MSFKNPGGGGGEVVVNPNSGLPENKSNQTLVNDDYLESQGSRSSSQELSSSSSAVQMQRAAASQPPSANAFTFSQIITIIILVYVNLINYMDRFTLAGVLEKIQDHYSINDSESGLIQTVFVISYMVFAPAFGYLGDRYSRKWIMAVGVFIWSLTTLLGSFMENSFWWFVFFRATVGIGEASYSTIAPTIISDMFTHDSRSKVLAVFYFAIPVGSGLGYIAGSGMADLFGGWQWALRLTPVLGSVAVFLILVAMTDPPRGESEGSSVKATSYKEDLIYLCKNKSFLLSTFGFTCVTFVAGALAWWGPHFVTNGLKIQEGAENVDPKTVSFNFGLVTMISGIIGVPFGSWAAQRLRTRIPRADPLLCAFGLLTSTPLMFLAAYYSQYHGVICFILIFFAELFLNLNWSIVADILLYTVIPTRRSTAEAFQILISHALGDAGSPYLIGVVSDWLKKVLSSEYPCPESPWDVPDNSPFNSTLSQNSTMLGLPKPDEPECVVLNFKSLQYALFITCFVEVLGGFFFLMNALYVVKDKNKCDRMIRNSAGGQLMPDEPSSQTEDEEEDPSREARALFPSTSS